MSQSFLHGYRSAAGMGAGDVRNPYQRSNDQSQGFSGNPGGSYNMPQMRPPMSTPIGGIGNSLPSDMQQYTQPRYNPNPPPSNTGVHYQPPVQARYIAPMAAPQGQPLMGQQQTMQMMQAIQDMQPPTMGQGSPVVGDTQTISDPNVQPQMPPNGYVMPNSPMQRPMPARTFQSQRPVNRLY